MTWKRKEDGQTKARKFKRCRVANELRQWSKIILVTQKTSGTKNVPGTKTCIEDGAAEGRRVNYMNSESTMPTDHIYKSTYISTCSCSLPVISIHFQCLIITQLTSQM